MISKTGIVKVATGIAGFDRLLHGGLPRGRTTVVLGPPGSGKTVLAVQFLYFGVQNHDESGVLVTFDESPIEVMQNVRSFGWDISAAVKQGRISIVDATSNPDEETIHTGPYNLTALVARTEHAIKAVGAKRVALDGIEGLFGLFPDRQLVGRELYRLAARLRKLGVTVVVTNRRQKDRNALSEVAADNIVVLRNRLEQDARRRTVEVLKVRGAAHETGQHRFAIDAEQGFVVLGP